MGETFGNYELLHFLGRGGMAEAFRARARTGALAGQEVAVKRMLPEAAADALAVDAFVNEAELTRLLDHPHIVKVLDVGAVGDQFFIAMELVEGRDLGAILQRCAERKILLPVDFGCYVAHVVAEALHYAHTAVGANGDALDIVHCDVTPSNVFISNLGDIKLGDFGVARSRGTRSAIDDVEMGGKASYLAPEQILGAEVSPATDVFSLGIVFAELLTNTKPFPGQTVSEIWERVVGGNAVAPRSVRPEISPEVNEVVLRALAPKPAHHRIDPQAAVLAPLRALFGRPSKVRYATASDLAADLESRYDPNIGTPLAIAAVVRGLFGTSG